MNDKDKFLEFAESLKLVRKTRIEDFIEDKNIDAIYADLLPKNGIINKVNLPRTTLLIGRKGTGKSTIFQKSQKDLISNKKCISIYIDVKSLYDNSSPSIPTELKDIGTELHRYLLYSNLIKEMILETKKRLSDFVEGSILKRILGFDLDQIDRIEEVLHSIETSISQVIKSIDISFIQIYKKTNEASKSNDTAASLKLSETPALDISKTMTNGSSLRTEFEETLVKYLDIKKCLIENLLKIKETLDIDHLYVFLDDYSEIDEEAQKIFMDWFIAPLNNLSDDFVKFKIAAYPHRFYYGRLDNSKIDEISLDFFDAFYSFEKKVDITKLESLALDYTDRLLTKRFDLFFPNNNWSRFFELDSDSLFSLLFSVSFNIPRKIGYILSYCYESCLIHNTKISKEAIENAAQRYYTDIVLKYFIANQYVSRPFNDKISNEHQFNLLHKIIERQKSNSSTANRARIKGKPSNHFVVNKRISSLLDNLELNGFITTYNNVYDSNSELSIIYSLDYGLCKRHGLNFMRAFDNKLLKYFLNARFNMNVLISEYFNKTQVIKCTKGHEFPYSMLDNLKLYNMSCPNCIQTGIISNCEVTVSNLEIRDSLKELEASQVKNISLNEFQILDYLCMVGKSVSNETISKALDRSVQTISSSMSKLNEKGFVKLDDQVSKQLRKDIYYLTDKGDKFVAKINQLISDAINKKRAEISNK